jgi:rhamnogalacturonan acetylesterase
MTTSHTIARSCALFGTACIFSAAASAQTANETPAAPDKPAATAEKAPPAADAARQGNPQAPRTGVLHPGYKPELPTLFLIGDSTVKNGRDLGGDGLWGWGSPIAAYFDTAKINIENQALGGTSSRSYYLTGHWERVSKLIKPGDFVMMQFGHNDGGGGGPTGNARRSLRGNGDDTEEVTLADGTKENLHSYGWYLRQFIAETKAKGATPIVCSLIPRNNWREGKINRGAGGYPTRAAEAAKQTDTQFIDLNGIISDHYDQLGQNAVKPFFPKEATHTGWKGAIFNAGCVVDGIKKLPDCKLNDFLNKSPTPPTKPSTDPTDG